MKEICEGCEEPECQDCCDHEFDPDEGFECLNCGKEGMEDIMSQAYELIKNSI